MTQHLTRRARDMRSRLGFLPGRGDSSTPASDPATTPPVLVPTLVPRKRADGQSTMNKTLKTGLMIAAAVIFGLIALAVGAAILQPNDEESDADTQRRKHAQRLGSRAHRNTIDVNTVVNMPDAGNGKNGAGRAHPRARMALFGQRGDDIKQKMTDRWFNRARLTRDDREDEGRMAFVRGAA